MIIDSSTSKCHSIAMCGRLWNLSEQNALICVVFCAEMKLLSNDALECIGGNRTTVELPTEVKRRIWKYVDWGSWW